MTASSGATPAAGARRVPGRIPAHRGVWRRVLAGALLTVAMVLGVWLSTGLAPAAVVGTVLAGTVGGVDPLAELLVRSVPLVIVGVGAAVALRGGVFNVGGEGQMITGAVMAALVTTAMSTSLPAPLVWLLATAAAVAAGAAWAVIPAWLWARRGVSEILSTLLMNFVAVGLLGWLLTATPLQDPDPYVITAQGEPLGEAVLLPIILGGTRLHIGVLVALAVAAAAWWFSRTTAGVAVDVVGANPRLAAQGGLRPAATRSWLLVSSAAVAGVAGAVQLLGVSHRLTMGLTAGVGYTGLLVAVVGRGRPGATAAAGLLFAFLITGGEALERAGVPRSLSLVVIGVVVAAVALPRWRSR